MGKPHPSSGWRSSSLPGLRGRECLHFCKLVCPRGHLLNYRIRTKSLCVFSARTAEDDVN